MSASATISPRVAGIVCPDCNTRVERIGSYIICACSYRNAATWDASHCDCGGIGYATHIATCNIVSR